MDRNRNLIKNSNNWIKPFGFWIVKIFDFEGTWYKFDIMKPIILFIALLLSAVSAFGQKKADVPNKAATEQFKEAASQMVLRGTSRDHSFVMKDNQRRNQMVQRKQAVIQRQQMMNKKRMQQVQMQRNMRQNVQKQRMQQQMNKNQNQQRR